MPDMNIIILMASFFLVNIIIGCFLSKSKDTEGFLIANRRLGFFQSIMTINGTFFPFLSHSTLLKLILPRLQR